MFCKKKLAASLVAVTVATAFLCGGTYAWQSISQTSLNVVEVIVAPEEDAETPIQEDFEEDSVEDTTETAIEEKES